MTDVLTPRQLVPTDHPSAQAAAHLRATADAPTIATMTPQQARIATLGYLQLQRPAPRMAHVEHRFIPGPTADLPIRILRPTLPAAPGPAIVVLHGSGWVACNLDVVDEPARVLAADTGLPVITVNYQKAPEHPYPTPLDDALATLTWVRENAAALTIDPDRIAVVGDSAGGNLAAAVTAELTAQGHAPAAQALLYPALDARRGSDSYTEFATGFGLDAADMAWFWGHYLTGTGCAATDPRVSPLLGSLAGLPPTFVATAGCDVLRDEGEQYADLAGKAGVQVVARRFEGAVHGFWWTDAVLDASRVLQRELAQFLVDTLVA